MFDNLNESSIAQIVKAAATTPRKFLKLKKLGKELVASKIKKATLKLDYDKKRAAAEDKKETATLKSAHEIKTQAVKDKETALTDKMSQLETTKALKAIGQTVRIQAKQEAAKKLYDAADGEERKALKVEIDKLKSDKEAVIKDYKSGSGEDDVKEMVNSIRNQLEVNPNYNKNQEARLEVENRLRKWDNLLNEMTELNSQSIKDSIILDINQLDKDIMSINSKHSNSNESETIRLAKQEAAMLGGMQNDPSEVTSQNVSRLDKTRALMRAAGLL